MPQKTQCDRVLLHLSRDMGGGVSQEVSEHGFVHGSMKVPIFGGFPVESPTNKALLSGISLSEYG